MRGSLLPSISVAKMSFSSRHGSRVYSVKYNPSGTLLAAAEQQDEIFVFDTRNGAYNLHTRFVPSVSWAVTELGWVGEDTLLYSTLNSRLHSVKIDREKEGKSASAQQQRPLTLALGDGADRYRRVYSFAVAPGAAEIAVAMSDGKLVLYSLERNSVVASWACHGDDINSVCYLSGEGGVS